MRRPLSVLGLVSSLLWCGGLTAQEPEDTSPHSDASLVAEYTSIQPGVPFTVALYIALDPGWHTYWINPGDAGMATSIEWDLPEGFQAGEIQWPHPTKIDVPPLVSYGYYDEVLLPVEITPPDDLPVGGTVTLAGRADWLICVEICLPAWSELELEIPVDTRTPASDPVWSDLFRATRAALPQPVAGWDLEAVRTDTGFDLRITGPEGAGSVLEGAYFFAIDETAVAPSQPQVLRRDGQQYVLSLIESPYLQGALERLAGVLLAPEGTWWDTENRVRALLVDEPVIAAAGPAPQREGNAAASVTLWVALALAVAGGVLLNLMPCVFPILSIKVLGFVHQGGQEGGAQRRARLHGLSFGAGVVLSFLALAGLIMALRAGGARLGWGFQLQSPAFVAAMAALFFVIALNLMGVFEVGTWLAGAAGRIAQPSGYADSFSSGILATLVATPCTAPFMGTAVGFALTQPAVTTLSVFAALGAGMAAPYVALSAAPALVARLPKPGAWMETLKQLLAFPLFATVIWLVWVFGLQTGMGGAAYLLSALMLLALAGWILGRWAGPLISSRQRIVTRSIVLATVLVAVGLAVRGTRGEAAAADGLEWQPFSPVRVQQLRETGQAVFVDFTAAWCITCQVNERVVLSSGEVRDAFRRYDVATVKADWTRFDAEITTALESFGRSGVPLYVLFPADPQAEAIVLPTILTRHGVIEALRAVTAAAAASAAEPNRTPATRPVEES